MGRRTVRIAKKAPTTTKICRTAAVKVSARESLDKLLHVILSQDTTVNPATPICEDVEMEEVSEETDFGASTIEANLQEQLEESKQKGHILYHKKFQIRSLTYFLKQ